MLGAPGAPALQALAAVWLLAPPQSRNQQASSPRRPAPHPALKVNVEEALRRGAPELVRAGLVAAQHVRVAGAVAACAQHPALAAARRAKLAGRRGLRRARKAAAAAGAYCRRRAASGGALAAGAPRGAHPSDLKARQPPTLVTWNTEQWGT